MSNKITFITANYNSNYLLNSTFNSIKFIIKDYNIDWYILDNFSNDNSLVILKQNIDYQNLENNIKIIKKKDFGIYDALNHGINLINTKYYLVLGAGDTLYFKNFHKIYKEISNKEFDLGIFNITRNNKLIEPKFKFNNLKFILTISYTYFLTSHSVGTIIKKSLHDKFGFYSRFYPIMADSFFLTKVLESYDSNIYYSNNLIGDFDNNGITSNNLVFSAIEYFSVQISLKRNIFLQLLFLFFRLSHIKLKQLNFV